LHKEE
jgi:hypothetical protein